MLSYGIMESGAAGGAAAADGRRVTGRVTEWIGAAEAAERLGIKQASLYAYVSRGVLGRRREAGSRDSLFDAEEIARLARKGRPGARPAGAELVIESSLTEITGDRLSATAATTPSRWPGSASFEEVASLLWTGALAPGDPAGWLATPQALAAGRAAQAALPAGHAARWSGSRSSSRPWPPPTRCACTWTGRR